MLLNDKFKEISAKIKIEFLLFLENILKIENYFRWNSFIISLLW